MRITVGSAASCGCSTISVTLALVIFFYAIPTILHDAIVADLVVKNSQSKGYGDFANSSSSPPVYMVYTFWNLTNAPAVLAGEAMAQYEAVGPYYYRKIEFHVNASFSTDGRLITSREGDMYVYDPPSAGLPDPFTDIAVGINPTYIGVLTSLGTDEILPLLLGGPVLRQVFDWMAGPWLQSLVLEKVASPLSFTVSQLLASAPTGLACGATKARTIPAAPLDCQLAFCTAWANATVPPSDSPLWLGLVGGMSGVSLETCVALFDGAASALALTALDPGTSSVWWQALNGNAALSGNLQSEFSMSAAQLTAVAAWLPTFASVYIYPDMVTQYSLGTIADLPYAQWAAAAVVPGGLAAAFPTAPVFNGLSDFEYALVMDSKSKPASPWLTVSRARTVLNDSAAGLFDPLNLIALVEAVASPNGDLTILSRFGLTKAQSLDLTLYFADFVLKYGRAKASAIAATGQTIFSARTINDWLFACTDPLLDVLEPGAGCSLIVNDTSADWVAANVPLDTIYSGAGSLAEIKNYQNYHGQTAILWNNYSMAVEGNDGTQSAPNLLRPFSESQIIYVFEDDVFRVLTLQFRSAVTVHGIAMNRFMPSQSLFAPDPRFFQFVQGFANLTSFSGGVPVFFSYPNMYLANASYVSKIGGMNPTPADEAYLDVEPITGATMNAHKQLQINIHVGPSLKFGTYNKAFNGSDVFYPLFWVDETSTIPAHLAKEFRDSVYLLRTLRIVLLVVLSVLAAAMAGLAVFLAVRAKAKADGRGRRPRGVDEITPLINAVTYN